MPQVRRHDAKKGMKAAETATAVRARQKHRQLGGPPALTVQRAGPRSSADTFH